MPGDYSGKGSFFLKSGPAHNKDRSNKGSLLNPKYDNPKNSDKMHRVEQGRIEKTNKPKEDKPFFNKKNYRIKKYSNKYKLDKWENQRRKDVLKKYYKDVKKDPMAGKYTAFNFDKAEDIGTDTEDEDGIKEDKADNEENDNQQEKVSSKAGASGDNKIHYVLHPDLLEKAKKNQQSNQKPGPVKSKIEDRLDKHGKVQPFWKVKQEMQRLRDEKVARKEYFNTAAKEREEAIAKYKLKKADKFKKLSKKTKTGQPLMRDRMQMLLESIQKST